MCQYTNDDGWALIFLCRCTFTWTMYMSKIFAGAKLFLKQHLETIFHVTFHISHRKGDFIHWTSGQLFRRLSQAFSGKLTRFRAGGGGLGKGWGNVGFVRMEISQLHIKIMFQEQQGCFMAFQFDYRHPFRLHTIECEINQLKWIERLYSTALVNDICYRILSVNLTHSLLSHSEDMSWQLPFKNKKGL